MKTGNLKYIVLLALAFYALLLLIVWFAPVEFTACSKDSLWCNFSYWITESAGKYGTIIIILLCSVFYSIRFEEWRHKMINFFKSVIALIIFLSVFAWVNEHVTKKAARLPRPSHTFIWSQTKPAIPIDSLYFIENEKRQQFLADLIKLNSQKFSAYDEKVLNHWAEEAGYSFPSGHSFNAFLLAVVLSFGLKESRRKIASYVWFLPLCWAPVVALSRVAIGAHSALDVSFGAAMGILVASLALYFDNTRRLIIHKKTTQD